MTRLAILALTFFASSAFAASPLQARHDTGTDEFVDLEPVPRFSHGFRVGYSYVNGETKALRSPHLFVIGYEATQRAIGGSWLNVITVENASAAGLNQSLFIPSFNGIVGFEIKEQLQIGTGINVMPFDPSNKYVHQIIAVGWTPPAGAFNVPLHFTYIPDVDGHYRLGATVGVNW